MKCPKCGEDLFGKQYTPGSPQAYDGVSEWICPQGHYRMGRWCGIELHGDEIETKFCMAKPGGTMPAGHGVG